MQKSATLLFGDKLGSLASGGMIVKNSNSSQGNELYEQDFLDVVNFRHMQQQWDWYRKGNLFSVTSQQMQNLIPKDHFLHEAILALMHSLIIDFFLLSYKFPLLIKMSTTTVVDL